VVTMSHSGVLPPAIADDLGFLLARASGLVVRSANSALESHGLRARHLTLMRLVDREALSQREISTHLGLDPSNVVALIDDLEALRFISRSPDPHDRRTRLISLTESGRRHLSDAETAAFDAIDETTAALSATERRQLVGLLSKVVSASA